MFLTAFIFLVTTLLGGGAFVLLGQRGVGNLRYILSFGGAFIIGMCFLHLVPEAFGATELAGIFVLVGFLLQGALEYMSQGIEHGHFHAHEHDENCEDPTRRSRLPWMALISLSLHAALESMPVVGSYEHHVGHVHGPLALDIIDWGLVTGLVLHKVPVSMVLMAMMVESHVPRRQAWWGLVIFGLAPLAGMASFGGLLHWLPSNLLVTFPGMMQAMVVGILLHIGTTVLFEAGEGHAFNKKKFLATCLGLGLGVLAFT